MVKKKIFSLYIVKTFKKSQPKFLVKKSSSRIDRGEAAAGGGQRAR